MSRDESTAQGWQAQPSPHLTRRILVASTLHPSQACQTATVLRLHPINKLPRGAGHR